MSDYRVIEESRTADGVELQIAYEGQFDSSVGGFSNDLARVFGTNPEVYGSGRSRRVKIEGETLRAKQNSTSSDYPTKSYSIHVPDAMAEDALPELRGEWAEGYTDEGVGNVSETDYSDATFEEVGEPANNEGWDGRMVRFKPPFTKEETGYDKRNVDESRSCKDCAHFVEGGGCKLVQGKIDPMATCDQFADFGMFGNNANVGGGVNLSVWGDKAAMNLTGVDVERILSEIESRFNKKRGGR